MIVLIRPDADAETVKKLMDSVRALGLEINHLDHAKGRGFQVRGSDRGQVLELRNAPGVETILTRRTALVGGEPLWPHFALRVVILSLLLLVLMVLLSAFVPPGLGDRAEPGGTGERVVEWYLRPLAAFLALLPGGRGVMGVVALLLWILFLIWPFLDRAEAGTPGRRRAVLLMRLGGIALIVLVLILFFLPIS